MCPFITHHADGGPPPGVSRLVRGARAVARGAVVGSQTGRVVQPALVNGAAGLVAFEDGRPVSVIGFTIVRDRIVAIDILADPARLSRLDLATLAGSARAPNG